LQALNSFLIGVDDSWKDILSKAFLSLDEEYLEYLLTSDDYFPSKKKFLNAFKTLSLDKTKYILFGQDPYPRKESATGYAFIDGRVKEIFSKKGLSKEVNRATSLRNFIKMLLLCEDLIDKNELSQERISKIDKRGLCDNIWCLKNNFEKNGVLLLNMALIFSSKQDSKIHLKRWKSFIETLLYTIEDKDITLILFGQASKEVEKFQFSKKYKKVFFPHPYNISFITNQEVHDFFKPMNLLKNLVV